VDKSWIFLSIILIGILGLAPLTPGEDTREVIATGVADGKTALARDEALNDALRKAVEQGVGTIVTADLTVEQQRLVEDRIYTESRGYIQRYKILSEETSDGLYEVQISAMVRLTKLTDDLQSIGLIIRKKRNPRVMVVVYSREMNSSYLGVSLEGNRNVENQTEKKLIAKGFQVLDAGQVSRKKELETLLLQGDPSQANRLAKDFGAELLVEADVRRTFVNQRMVFGRSTHFFSNEVRMKAIETDTAKVLYSGFRTKPASGAEALTPLEESATELIDEMVVAILEQWRKDIFQAATCQLDISKATFSTLSVLKEQLGTIRGVKGLQVRSFQSGRALMEVIFQGSPEELADKINELERPQLIITGLQSNTIEIELQK